MIKRTSSNQPIGRDGEYIFGAFIKSFSICWPEHEIRVLMTTGTEKFYVNTFFQVSIKKFI